MKPAEVETYGLTLPGPANQATIELMLAFNERLASAPGFLGRYQHLRNAIDLMWNVPRRRQALERKLPYDERKHDAFHWQYWSELLMSAFCEWYEQTIIAGPNASNKTTGCAMFVLEAFFASPHNTSVIVTSTDYGGLKKRVWGDIVKYHRLCPAVGTVTPSDLALRYIKGDDKNGIFGIATGQNDADVEKAVNKILGFHNTNVFVVCDEMQATNAAIVEACISLKAGTERFQFFGPGNPDSELDTQGRAAEPVNGWGSITLNDERWETKKGICIHLNGMDSPRVKEGDEYYPGLLKKSDIDDTRRDYGEDSPQFYSKRLGFWAPQGVQKTVLSMPMITKGQAREKAVWVGSFKTIWSLDPSFEGNDRCVLRFHDIGEIVTPDETRQVVLATKEIILIKVTVKSDEPIHYQITRRVKEECTARGLGPQDGGLDSSGEGGGLASIMSREWGPGFEMVEFGGRPSKDPVSLTNPKRADMEYDRKVTELCMRFQTAVLQGQIRELDLDTIAEFCQRRFDVRNNVIIVEKKSDMKARTGKSPDLMDNALVGLEVARRRGLLTELGSTAPDNSADAWNKQVREYQMADEENYLLADV